MDHILVDPETGSVTGVIDFGDAVIGDPAYDFCGLHRDLLLDVLAAYGGKADGAFLDRIDFYASLAPFHEIHFGVKTGDAKHVQRALETLKRKTTAIFGEK